MLDSVIRKTGPYGKRANKSLLKRLAGGDVVTIHDYDDSTQTTIIETIQDLDPYIEANKREQASGHDGYTPSREMRKVASIPIEIVNQWMVERGINALRPEDWPKVAALLDDPDHRFLRTDAGVSRISRRMPRDYYSMHDRTKTR